MASGKWLWDEDMKSLRFEKNKSKSFDLRSMDKFKYERTTMVKAKRELMEQDKNKVVTLDDVKRVALNLITEDSLLNASLKATKIFDECYRVKAMDGIIWCALKYYTNLQQYKLAASDEGLQAEGEIANKARVQLKTSQDMLSQSVSDFSAEYILLISGIKINQLHHSHQGQLRYSKTQFDQQFFEVFYEFLMIVTWITFEYQNWDDIRSELGRILRTNAYNRFVPVERKTLSSGGGRRNMRIGRDLLSARAMHKRPELGSLKKLKSPIAEVLYPNTKTSESMGKPLPNLEYSRVPKTLGILGDLYSNYIPSTLKLKDEIIIQRREEAAARARELLLMEQEQDQDDD